MRTVRRALTLLNFFSESSPEYGLSELARTAGYDKATTQRMLSALADHGMVEQHPESKKYRLGAGLLRLARVREATFPIGAVVEPVLRRLAEKTRETAHFSMATGDVLSTLGIAESPRTNRISMQRGEQLPLHCTGSGIAYLAFSPEPLVDGILAKPLAKFTPDTITEADKIRAMIETARRSGIGKIHQGYDQEVSGVAAPIFDWTGFACGAIAVATPSTRMTPEAEVEIGWAVRTAAIEVTKTFGADPHDILLQAQAGANGT
ncbi:IclR family transcriptional regulator [Pelagibius sp. Alg239-R121]|uniref:IclR family transcriptional regulator n=1 Tax=Pelagibius sp. Alg239-R121 TaxID=2993448 RepID=UPI0024A66932|nr:IclR family transcriptional regulator [Pelagibius sp. Alg239-R121]